MSNIGLAELAPPDLGGYVRAATEWADDLPRLAGLRATMRERVLASPLTDVRRFAGNIEAAYRGMWRAWCDSKTS